MLAGDNLEAAIHQEASFQDRRISHYWDGERAVGRRVAQTLGLTAPIAWDIYLLYPAGIKDEGEDFPLPHFWMHQLDERPDLLLDPARLTSEVQRLIEDSSNKDLRLY